MQYQTTAMDSQMGGMSIYFKAQHYHILIVSVALIVLVGWTTTIDGPTQRAKILLQWNIEAPTKLMVAKEQHGISRWSLLIAKHEMPETKRHRLVVAEGHTESVNGTVLPVETL